MTDSVVDTTGFEFWRRQIERLGAANPLDVLASTPDALDRIVAAHPPAQFTVPPAPGKWSGVEVMGHLVDIDIVFGFRSRTVLADATPSFAGIDQDRWVEAQRWRDVAPGEIARRFRLLRSVNLETWSATTTEDRTRTGRHLDAGVDLSLDLLIRILAGHDLVHLDQLRAVLGGG